MSSRTAIANALRVLSMDAVERAHSGHPGMPMGMATIAEVLWRDFLKHNPADPSWPNRDRFILSNGHGSMLQYALLYLSGYDLTIDDIKQFRQLHSKTPGHPEVGITPGVETTTGPLGQGLANGLGMALAEAILSAKFNRGQHTVVDHYTYVFLGDGCLMEGISHESCSLAGTLGLGKLICFWDDNGISIDGAVQGWFTEDIEQRFAAYGWQVIADVDGHDSQAVHDAIISAQQVTTKPTLICCQTQIGYGAPNLAGSAKTHGAPLGSEEIAKAREQLSWPHPEFVIPDDILLAWDAREAGQAAQDDWEQQFKRYQQDYPELAAELKRRLNGELSDHWSTQAQDFIQHQQQAAANMATRKASLAALNHYVSLLPEMVGGSADLTGSNLTKVTTAKVITAADADGNYIYYGVREFAMSAIMNGMALHGGFIPFAGTFLTFLDYARNAVRMAALMRQRVIFVYTHDSIGLGEDGPTHQPIEHLAILRVTPNMSLWRPCDTVETAVAWRVAIEHTTGPTCLALSRQNVPHQQRSPEVLANIAKGGYVLADCVGVPQVILIATGSEVALAMDAREQLHSLGLLVRVVSLPSVDVFEQQSAAYQESVLPKSVTRRVIIEAGATRIWHGYAGSDGVILGIDDFGESAPGAQVYEHFGLTSERIVASVKAMFFDN